MTGSGNWTYLVVGARPLLIDAGVGASAHLDAIAVHLADGPEHVIVTHAHPDHASGVEAIARRWPRTVFSKFPWIERDGHHAVTWHALEDGTVVPAGDDSLDVVHTPGHAPDHICLWHASTRTLFGGDLLVRGTTVVIPASAGGSVSAYLRSLERVLALEPSRVLPAHGPAIDDPATLIRGYIEHRHDRERQVMAALRSGDLTVEAITNRIYVGLSEALRAMAQESVLAHLVKLEHDGLVYRTGNEWHSLA